MKFGRLRHKILIAKPTGTTTNRMGEKVPAFSLFHPNLAEQLIELQDGQWVDLDGNSVDEHNSNYAISAEVTPLTGRQYEQSQKLRAETTYNIKMRYMPGMCHEMIIIYNGKKIFVESVLEANTPCTELLIVGYEVNM